MKATLTIKNEKVVINFNYSETCGNVYKSLSITRNDKKTNITWLKNRISVELPYIFTANTYFWRPGSSARERRAAETRRAMEAYDFFEKIGATIE